MSRTVIVTSIFGQQQSAVARAFHQRGWTVRGTSRTEAPHDFAKVAEADLLSGKGLFDAFQGADVVAFTVLQDHRPGVMEATARNVRDHAARAGVRRILYNLAATIDETSDVAPFPEMRAARAVFLDGPVPATILQPTVYMDNLLAPWSVPQIREKGVLAYPIPPGVPVSWISHRTLADFMVAAAENAEAGDKEYHIGGPTALTSDDLVAAFERHLGRRVTYHQVPLTVMADNLNTALGAPAGDRIIQIYARLEREKEALSLDDAAATELAVKAESFQTFLDRAFPR